MIPNEEKERWQYLVVSALLRRIKSWWFLLFGLSSFFKNRKWTYISRKNMEKKIVQLQCHKKRIIFDILINIWSHVKCHTLFFLIWNPQIKNR